MYFSLQIPFLLSELSFEHALYEFQGCQNPPKQKKRVPSLHFVTPLLHMGYFIVRISEIMMVFAFEAQSTGYTHMERLTSSIRWLLFQKRRILGKIEHQISIRHVKVPQIS